MALTPNAGGAEAAWRRLTKTALTPRDPALSCHTYRMTQWYACHCAHRMTLSCTSLVLVWRVMANTPPVSLRIPEEFQPLIRQALARLKSDNGCAARLQELLMGDPAIDRHAVVPPVLDEIRGRLETVENGQTEMFQRLEKVERGQTNHDAAPASLPAGQSKWTNHDPAWKTAASNRRHLSQAGLNAIIEMFIAGLSNKKIADLMQMSQLSVGNYRRKYENDEPWGRLIPDSAHNTTIVRAKAIP